MTKTWKRQLGIVLFLWVATAVVFGLGYVLFGDLPEFARVFYYVAGAAVGMLMGLATVVSGD